MIKLFNHKGTLRFHKGTLIIFLLLLLSTSCSYKPQLTAIPLLEKKGDMQIDGTLSPLTISASLTGSYAVTNHFAVQVFGDAGANYISYGQGALGYFTKFNDRLVFENYTGFGYGYSEDIRSHSAHDGEKGNYYLGFTQINLGENWSRRVHFGYGAGIKIGYLLHDILMYREDYSDGYRAERTFSRKISSSVIEPNLFFRIGGKNLKFYVQGAFCISRQWNHRDELLYFFPFNIGIGMSYRFSTLKK